MESTFKLKITPNKLHRLFNNTINIRSFELLGIHKEGDTSHYTNDEWDKVWDSIQDTECIYKIRLRHQELSRPLDGKTYKSWDAVTKAIKANACQT